MGSDRAVDKQKHLYNGIFVARSKVNNTENVINKLDNELEEIA